MSAMPFHIPCPQYSLSRRMMSLSYMGRSDILKVTEVILGYLAGEREDRSTSQSF